MCFSNIATADLQYKNNSKKIDVFNVAKFTTYPC